MDKERKITIYEEEFDEQEAPKEKSVQLVIFRVGSEWYGADAAKVREVVKSGIITYLPSAPDYIDGIVHLRGNILSVTNLKNIFGLPAARPDKGSNLVVIVSGDIETAILADEVTSLEEVPLSRIDPALATIAPEKAGYIEGQCTIDDKLVGILNVDKLLAKPRGAQC